MRAIGVNQYVGEHPANIYWCKEFERNFASRRLEERAKLQKLDPVSRFFRLAGRTFDRPMSGRYQGIFSYDQKILLEIERVSDKHFPDVERPSEFMVLLRSFYVLDTERGKGVGKNVLEQIRKMADEAQCLVCLFASAFGFSRHGGMPMAITSFSDLLHVALVEKWEIVYEKEMGDEALKFFYTAGGFRNVCLSSPNSMHDDDGRDKWATHFAYLPAGLENKYFQRFLPRLNPELSEFCDCR